MTYEEKKAAERAADLAKPFLQRQECRNDQQYRPLLLEPVIDREKLKRKAKLVKKMRSTRWPEEMLHESNPEDKEALEDEYEQFEDEMRDHPTIGIFTRGSDGKVTLRPADEPAAQEPAATEPEPDTKLCCAVDHGTGCASRTYHGTDCPGAESCPVKQYEDEECERENAEMGAALRRNREDATAQEPAATNPEPGPAAQEPATLTIREMILEHGINPDDIDGLAECGDLKVDRRVYWEHISENGVIFECEENIRLWLLRRSRDDDKHFTIEVAPWNLADDGPYGPFIDTSCRAAQEPGPPDYLDTEESDYIDARQEFEDPTAIPTTCDSCGGVLITLKHIYQHIWNRAGYVVRKDPTAPPEYHMLSYVNDTQLREMFEHAQKETVLSESPAETAWVLAAFQHEFETREPDPLDYLDTEAPEPEDEESDTEATELEPPTAEREGTNHYRRSLDDYEAVTEAYLRKKHDPAAKLYFTGPAEYKAWAAGATQEQIHAYWDSLSDFEFQILWDDLDDYEGKDA